MTLDKLTYRMIHKGVVKNDISFLTYYYKIKMLGQDTFRGR